MKRGEAARRIKEIALEEGFDRAGVARLGPAATAEAFHRWLADGRQAGMSYLDRQVEVRDDPRRLLAAARSILCVALQYAPRPEREACGPALGDFWPRVARYARGEDYHDFMRAALKQVAARVESEFPGVLTRVCVDTAPILEREWAARAGLGAVGKNTQLLHPEAGSWFLLGEVVLTLDLAADLPVSDLCASCTRCLEACPTGALTAPFELDSRRCISYWTIEHRGEIPVEMRGELAGWVFGCDICQEVCPWNSRALESRAEQFATPPQRVGLDLVALLECTDDELSSLFRGTPLLRPRPEGLRRNLRLAIEATGRNASGEPPLTA